MHEAHTNIMFIMFNLAASVEVFEMNSLWLILAYLMCITLLVGRLNIS